MLTDVYEVYIVLIVSEYCMHLQTEKN